MNAPLLLDTCACLWVVAGELSETGVAALNEAYDARVPVYVSPITALEIGTLARKGKFRSHLSPRRWFERLMNAPGAALAAMPPELLMESALLPDYADGDPGDRILAATAREFGYTLMTRDAHLLDYGKQGYLSVVEC